MSYRFSPEVGWGRNWQQHTCGFIGFVRTKPRGWGGEQEIFAKRRKKFREKLLQLASGPRQSGDNVRNVLISMDWRVEEGRRSESRRGGQGAALLRPLDFGLSDRRCHGAQAVAEVSCLRGSGRWSAPLDMAAGRRHDGLPRDAAATFKIHRAQAPQFLLSAFSFQLYPARGSRR